MSDDRAMKLEVSPAVAQLLRQHMAAGGYKAMDEFLLATLRQPKLSRTEHDWQQLAKRQSWNVFEARADPETLAAQQGVKPVRHAKEIVFPHWPENETVDTFLTRA